MAPEIKIANVQVFKEGTPNLDIVKLAAQYGGFDHTAHIVAFRRMRARTAIRKVAKVLDVLQKVVLELIKKLPKRHRINLEKTIQQNRKLQNLGRKSKMEDLVKIAKVLDGLPIKASLNTRTALASEESLMNCLPLTRNVDGALTTQYDESSIHKLYNI